MGTLMNFGNASTVAVVLVLWSICVIVLLAVLDIFSSSFFRFGPSNSVKVFDFPINSWTRWTAIVAYIVVSELVTTYGLETLTPWQLNQVQNPSVFRIPETRARALTIVNIWYFYLWLGRVVSIQLLLSQIDFLLIILVVDLCTTSLVIDRLYLARKSQSRDYTLLA